MYRCLQCDAVFPDPQVYSEEDAGADSLDAYGDESIDHATWVEMNDELQAKVGSECCPECQYGDFEPL